MVVVVILSILAAVVVPRIMDNPDKARVVKAKQDIRVIKNQMDLYRLHNFRYPTTEQGMEALVQNRPTRRTGRKAATWTKCLKTPGASRINTSVPASMATLTSTRWAPTVNRAAKAWTLISVTGIWMSSE